MKIEQLNKEMYAGKKFLATYTTAGYYDIEVQDETFSFVYKPFEQIKAMSFESAFFEEWLEEPIAYGVFEHDILLGFAEGFMEKWNNRYRISNICIFEEQKRRCGLGDLLMNQLIDKAKSCGARMVVLETQSCNEKAIAFYKKHGFNIIGFDLYSYTNSDPERHEVRVEMGMAF